MDKVKVELLLKELSKIASLYKANEFENVIQNSKKLLKSYPKFSPIYNFLGLSYRQLGKVELAEKTLLEGYSKDPRNPSILGNLGSIYRVIGNKEKSINFFEEAIKIAPNDIAVLVNFGNALSDFNSVEDSIKCYEKAKLIDGNNQQILINLAGSYQVLGKFDEARELLKNIIRKFPHLTIPHKMLSDITKYKKNDKHQIEMLKYANYIENNSFKINDEIKYPLFFGLAKSFEDQNEFKEAFKWLKKGNNTKKKSILESFKKLNKENPIKKELLFIKRIKKIFQNIEVDKYDDVNKSGENLIFVLGLPRSGTTLTHQIIASHSKAYGAGELNLLTRAVYNNIDDKNFINIFQNKNFENLNKIIINYNERCKNINSDNKMIVDKSPMNFRMIGFIRMLFPKSKIIHCTRDAKDNCLSIYKNVFNEANVPWSYDLDDLTEYYKEYMKLMHFWNLKLPNFIFNSNYETLINNQEIQSKKIFNFCNLEWEKDSLTYYKKQTPIQTLSIEQARKPIYRSSIKNFVKYSQFLDFKEIEKIESEFI